MLLITAAITVTNHHHHHYQTKGTHMTNLSTYDLDLAAIVANRRDQARWDAIEIDALRAARQKREQEEGTK